MCGACSGSLQHGAGMQSVGDCHVVRSRGCAVYAPSSGSMSAIPASFADPCWAWHLGSESIGLGLNFRSSPIPPRYSGEQVEDIRADISILRELQSSGPSMLLAVRTECVRGSSGAPFLKIGFGSRVWVGLGLRKLGGIQTGHQDPHAEQNVPIVPT